MMQISQSVNFNNLFRYSNTVNKIQQVKAVFEKGTKWFCKEGAFNSELSKWKKVISFTVKKNPISGVYHVDATIRKEDYHGGTKEKA